MKHVDQNHLARMIQTFCRQALDKEEDCRMLVEADASTHPVLAGVLPEKSSFLLQSIDLFGDQASIEKALCPGNYDCSTITSAKEAWAVAREAIDESRGVSSQRLDDSTGTRDNAPPLLTLLCAASVWTFCLQKHFGKQAPSVNETTEHLQVPHDDGEDVTSIPNAIADLMRLDDGAPMRDWYWFFCNCKRDMARAVVLHFPQGDDTCRPLLYAKAAPLLQTCKRMRQGIRPVVEQGFSTKKQQDEDDNDSAEESMSTGRVCDIFDGGGLWDRLGQDEDENKHRRRIGIPMNKAGQIAAVVFSGHKKAVFLNEASLCAAAIVDARERWECVRAFHQLLLKDLSLSERRQSWLPDNMMFAVVLRKQARLRPRRLRKSAVSPEGELWVLDELRWPMTIAVVILCLVTLLFGGLRLASLALVVLTIMLTRNGSLEYLRHGRIRVQNGVGYLGDTMDQAVYTCFQDGTNAFSQHFSWSGDHVAGGTLPCNGLRMNLLRPTELWGNILVTADGMPLCLVRQDDGNPQVAKAEHLEGGFCVYKELQEIVWIQ